jgi:hypothetical protein
MEEKVIYIPKDLDDCFEELKKMFDDSDFKDFVENSKEEDMVLQHHFLGRWLRNNWGLWQGSRLQDWFKEKGIHHADDMSAIILDSFWRHTHDKPIKLDEQIKHYQDFWEEQNANKTEESE